MAIDVPFLRRAARPSPAARDAAEPLPPPTAAAILPVKNNEFEALKIYGARETLWGLDGGKPLAEAEMHLPAKI